MNKKVTLPQIPPYRIHCLYWQQGGAAVTPAYYPTNVEVCLFPESYCIASALVADFASSDATPVFRKDSELVHEPVYRSYIRLKNVSSDLYMVMPFPDMM